jgi:hypothetical protein
MTTTTSLMKAARKKNVQVTRAAVRHAFTEKARDTRSSFAAVMDRVRDLVVEEHAAGRLNDHNIDWLAAQLLSNLDTARSCAFNGRTPGRALSGFTYSDLRDRDYNPISNEAAKILEAAGAGSFGHPPKEDYRPNRTAKENVEEFLARAGAVQRQPDRGVVLTRAAAA